MIDEVRTSCRNCERKDKDYVPVYDWRKVKLLKFGTLKETEAIEISCPVCNRTIVVMPSHLFFEE